MRRRYCRMSPPGYEQTLGGPRCEVRSPLESRRKCHEIRKPRVIGPLTAQYRTSEVPPLEVNL